MEAAHAGLVLSEKIIIMFKIYFLWVFVIEKFIKIYYTCVDYKGFVSFQAALRGNSLDN